MTVNLALCPAALLNSANNNCMGTGTGVRACPGRILHIVNVAWARAPACAPAQAGRPGRICVAWARAYGMPSVTKITPFLG